METDIIKYILTQGPFAVLFVWLLVYVMKTNKERESRLQDLLDRHRSKFDVISRNPHHQTAQKIKRESQWKTYYNSGLS